MIKSTRLKRIGISLALTMAMTAFMSPFMGFAASKEVNVSAAASLMGPLGEIEKSYEKSHKGTDVVINYGSAGALQVQIENGAPCDIFISAAAKQMDALQSKGLIINKSRKNLLGNRLVLVVPVSNNTLTKMSGITGAAIRNIAIGTPETVPVGQYTTEYLKNIGIYDSVQSKFVQAKDVKEVLAWVETGNADAGFVYYSDAKGNKKVRIVAKASTKKLSKIVYPAALVRSINALENDGPKDFMKYLKTSKAKKVFVKYGFSYLYKIKK
jgi:molybdate transport system substrate-binding protein